ncbi:MAG: M20/M25/M40 family metallo-hydrolase [Polyangiaceae bacterium]
MASSAIVGLSFLMGCTLAGCAATPIQPASAQAPKPAASIVEAPAPLPAPPPASPPGPASPELENAVLAQYGATAQRIREAALANDAAFQKLSELTDRIGARLSGSPALDRALEWAKGTLLHDGHERVRLEPVKVPHWLRGAQAAQVLSPVPRELPVLTLGGSVATAPGGVTAELIAVSSFEELEARKAEVKGKIVLFDHPMSSQGHPGLAYGEAIAYRTTSASRAAPLGALAVLVRSLTAHSLGAPHTGSMRYPDPKAPKIPGASVSVEDAEWLHRLARRGDKPRIHLTLSPQTLPDAPSANVIAEIRGREAPDQIVVISAHLDSWDVGQGAQDDGAGVVTVMQALTTLRSLGLVPRRTLRVVLFTNEENGLRGAAQYALDHRAERHVAAFEMDAGAGAPLGFMTEGEQPYLSEARQISALLAPIGASSMSAGFSGEDVLALKPAGVPLFGVNLDLSHYFDVHHSAADTLDKVDPEQLKKLVAAMATMAFVVADRQGAWDTPPARNPP